METGPIQKRMLPMRAVLAFVTCLVLVVGAGCAHQPEAPPEAASAPPGADDYARQLALIPGAHHLAETYGVELIWLRLTARGAMLDLRYRVFDPERAAPLFGGHQTPQIYLVDKGTGQEAQVPQTMVGQLRQKAKRPRSGRIYYVIFKNPSNSITAGTEVELHFGDVILERVPVM